MATNYEELEKLAQLKEKWILSNEEFEIEKKRILEWNVWNSTNHNNFSNNFINYQSLSTYYEKKSTFWEFFFISKWRFDRLDFLLAWIWYFIYWALLWFIINILISKEYLETEGSEFIWLFFIIIVWWSFLYSLYIINIKRLHDLNLSWWLSTITLMLAPFSTLFLLLIPWTNWDNKYWPQK